MPTHWATSDGTVRGFPTPTRRIEIYSERLLEHGYAPVPAFAEEDAPAGTSRFPLRLGAAKSVAYCHSQHRNIASLRRLAPDPSLEMVPTDAAARGIGEGDWVRITHGRRAKRSPVPSWCLGWPREPYSASTVGGSMARRAAPTMLVTLSPPTSTV